MTQYTVVDKAAVLAFLAEQVVRAERAIALAEDRLDALQGGLVGSEEWLSHVLRLTAGKAVKASAERTVDHLNTLDLEEW